MRQVHLSDLHIAALTLSHLPKTKQAKAIRLAIYEAHCADKYRKRLRRAHPRLGNGTLISALASRVRTPKTQANHKAYLGAMRELLDQILSGAGR